MTILLLALISIGAVQNAPYTPKPGSAERKALMDSLRVPVEKELGRKTIFKIDHLKVQNGWAFITGVPLQQNGGKMDYKGTRYQKMINDGAFDDWICALLQQRDGKWTVVAYEIGATDVVYIGWDEKFNAPPLIFE